MGLFRRDKAARDEATDVPAVDGQAQSPATRYEVMQCAGCRKRTPPFVYMSNGKDYCVPCARSVATLMRIHPAGKRDGDITSLDL